MVYQVLWQQMSTSRAKLPTVQLPVTPPELSLRQPVHNGTFFHSTLCTRLQPSTHGENVTTVTCVEYGFVSHFIGGKIGIATFFILNRAFWKQVAIEHTPTLSPGVGTVGFMWTSGKAMRSNHPKEVQSPCFPTNPDFSRDTSVCDNVITLHTMTNCPSLVMMGRDQKAGASVLFWFPSVL